jgi:hypothetical protein
MLGFAVVDAVPKGESVAVWLTSLVEPQRASHVNAVVIAREDPDLVRKVRALCGDRAVVLTDSSNTDGLGIDAAALGPDALQVLVAETTEHRARIIDAVTEYGRRTAPGRLCPSSQARPRTTRARSQRTLRRLERSAQRRGSLGSGRTGCRPRSSVAGEPSEPTAGARG